MSAEVPQTLERVWHVQPDMARRPRQRLSTVMEWAIGMQNRADNPFDLHADRVSYLYYYS